MAGISTAGLLAGPLSFENRSGGSAIKAVAFDAFPIFDPRPIFKHVMEEYPEKGKQLVDAWQAKQFGYQWLRAAGNQYKNFWDVTRDALGFAFRQCQLEADGATLDRVMENYHSLSVWPDVSASLEVIRQKGVKIGFLSNMTGEMLRRGIQRAGIEKYFDYVISTDQKKTYKPSPDAYRIAMDQLQLKKAEILFVPFAGWDMAGGKWFGYPTYWVNRLNAPADMLDAVPDGVGNSLSDLMAFMFTGNKK